MKGLFKRKIEEDEEIDIHEYTTGDSDTEYETPFHHLSKDEKEVRLKHLWNRAYFKSLGASKLINSVK
jgi:hypothetical protein